MGELFQPLTEEEGLRVVALFDNEEIGSKTDRGADSRMLLAGFCFFSLFNKDLIFQFP